jgi:hypothetical protein
MKPTELFEALRIWAPFVAFKVDRSPDDSFQWDGDGPDPRDSGFDCFDVDVSATAISAGKKYVGYAYMGGHYDKPPFNADLGGYLPQLLCEAAQELEDALTEAESPTAALSDCRSAIRFLKDEMQQRYDAQTKTA